MTTVKTLSRSFAGGEIAPELYGRLDLVKIQTGLAQALNAWVLPHGPVQNRPGFEYVLEVKNSAKRTRVVPFSYSTEQTFIIEFGDQYIRWHTQGATLLESNKNITGITQPAGVVTSNAHGFNDGEWVYLSGIGGMVELNGRTVVVSDAAANTFRIKDFAGNYITTGTYGAYTAGGTAARVYEIATPYLEADLFDLHFVQSADVLTIVHPGYAPRELRRLGATNWQLSTISFVPTIATPVAPAVATGGPGGGTPINHFYQVTALADGSLEESLASPASAAASIDLLVTGNYVDVTPPAVAGAVRFNVYKLDSGLYGYIGQTAPGSAFRDDNVTADISQTPPLLANPFNAANEYPGAVGYYEQRRCFAGSNNKPQNFWATRTATENNLAYSIPTRDDDAISFRIAAREVNRIRHIISLDQLILLTSGGEWRVAPLNSDVLTPSSAGPKLIAAEGANNVQPVITASSVLYVQELGSRMREMKYQWEANGYQVGDISIMAPHLFDGYTITDLAYAKAPYKFIWGVRSDGVLLGLTYLPEQQVIAWHQHSTVGSFESVACVKEGTEYPLYVVAKRTINGRNVRYIERMHSRQFASRSDCFFVDSGLTYDGAPNDEISGLWHLEGAEVAVLADGAEVTGLTIQNGVITLPQESSVVHIGLPIDARAQTLPLSIDAMQAGGQGTTKNINEVYLRMKDSSGFLVGPTFDDTDMVDGLQTMRTDEPYGTPPALFNGVGQITVMPQWGQDVQLCIRQRAPLPFTILSMALEVALGA